MSCTVDCSLEAGWQEQEKTSREREWMDDVVEWCKGANLQELSHSARDRSNWQKMAKQVLDISGH